MKIAIFWDKRFNNNKFLDLDIDKNLSPFIEFATVNGLRDTISFDLLENREDRDNFVILCFLTFNIYGFYRYIYLFFKYPKQKKYLFLFEPKVVAGMSYWKVFHIFFERIYTWEDSRVDKKKYFKYIWPQSLNSIQAPVNFNQRKFIVLMNANKFSLGKNELYSAREKFIRFCEIKGIDFDLYGPGWGNPNLKQKFFGYQPYTSWRGRAEDKIKTIGGYKFNICFENMSDTPGYITEKIWDSFKAKTVPVYWGASNIEEYIPKNCFIDYRDFGDFAKLEKFLSEITEDEYNAYIKHIEKFLQTEKAKEWFDRDWATNFIKKLG